MRLSHAWALASSKLTVDAVELAQFPELSDRFHVNAVPTVIMRSGDRRATLAGALPEPMLLARLLQLSHGDQG